MVCVRVRLGWYLVIGLGLVLAGGCGGEPDEASLVRGQGSALIDGSKASHPLVGALYSPLGACTATLIRPYHVLTSAHCVAPMGETTPAMGMLDFYLGGSYHPTYSASVTVHPSFANNKGKDLSGVDAYVEGDLALVSFEHEVGPGVDVTLASQAPQALEPLVIWGLGKSAAEGFGSSRKANNDVREIYSTFFLMFADKPDYGTVASGDSGGPSFNAQGALVGVHSGVLSGEFSFDGGPPRTATGREAKDIRVDVFRPWIEQAMKAYDAPEEPPPCEGWDCPPEPPCEGGDCPEEPPPCEGWWDCPGKEDRLGGAAEGSNQAAGCSVGHGSGQSGLGLLWLLLLLGTCLVRGTRA
jgi:hypothetical protein